MDGNGFAPDSLEMQVAFEASCHALKAAEGLNAEIICEAAEKARGRFQRKRLKNIGKASLYTFIVAFVSYLISCIPDWLAGDCSWKWGCFGFSILFSIAMPFLVSWIDRMVPKSDLAAFSLEDVLSDEKAKKMRKQYGEMIKRDENKGNMRR